MNARQTSSLPEPALPALHYPQLLPAHEALRSRRRSGYVEYELERVRRWYGSFVTGYVVMPEHFHLLCSEPKRDKLSLVIQMLKQITPRKLKPPDQPRFWQVRYYDFPVWSKAKRIEKLRYIHRNPVKRGLVERPEDWKWSSLFSTPPGRKGLSRSSRNGQRVVANSWESYRQSRKPTLPQKPREGWGNLILTTYEEWASSLRQILGTDLVISEAPFKIPTASTSHRK